MKKAVVYTEKRLVADAEYRPKEDVIDKAYTAVAVNLL